MKKQEKRQRMRKCANRMSDSEEDCTSSYTAKRRRLGKPCALRRGTANLTIIEANGLLYDVEVRLVSTKSEI